MTSSKAEQIRNRLLEFCTLFSFEYKEKVWGIDPFNPTLFRLYCGEYSEDIKSIEKVMQCPVFDGECLNDIADSIEILDW